MATIPLSSVVILYGSATRAGGQIRLTNNWMDLTVAYQLDPDTSYIVEVDLEAKFSTWDLTLYSSLGPTEAQVDLSNWEQLGWIEGVYGDTTTSLTIGPGVEDWDAAVAGGEHYLIIDCNFHVKRLRIREVGTEEPPPAATVDFPCTYTWTYDGVTYPWDSYYADEWDPPQATGFATQWGYIVPDTGCWFTVADLGANIWTDEGYLIDRSHASVGADFDPARGIALSLSNPGVYGPPPGVIEDDGSITWFGDPFDPGGPSWFWDAEEPSVVKFEGAAPSGISLENFELVVHHYGGGADPKVWMDWVNDDGDHRTACILLRMDNSFQWMEDSGPLPADFPIDRLLAGEQFIWHFTIVGGFYWGLFAYVAIRFQGGGTTSYRRLFPRDDGLAGGARRTFPPSRGVQSKNRLTGYL